jgi:hypothetical protein
MSPLSPIQILEIPTRIKIVDSPRLLLSTPSIRVHQRIVPRKPIPTPLTMIQAMNDNLICDQIGAPRSRHRC